MRAPAEIQLQPLERQRQWQWEEIPILELRLSVPHCVSDDRRIRRINRYYESFARSCEQYAHRFLFPAATEVFAAALAENHCPAMWHFHAAFSTQLLSQTLWSLTLETEEMTGSTPYRCRYADTWDLRSGYPLSLAEFFPAEPLYRRRLKAHARDTLLSRQAQGAALHENWKHRLISAWNKENFYLNNDGLHWFYPMYALGGEALGIPDFFLPWDNEKNPRLPASPLDSEPSRDIR